MTARDWLQTATVMILFIAVLVFAFSRGAFVGESIAIRTLETQGYSNIKIVDHIWFLIGVRGCDGGDAARFTAKATNPVGKPVEVFVCTGLFFKGGTIRVD